MSDAVERVESSWAGLTTAVEGIDPARMAEPGVAGDWSVKDLLAHVAFWEGHVVNMVRRAQTGEPAPAGDGQDFEIVNQNVYAERAGWSVEQTLAEFHDTHERVMTALRTFPTIDPDLVEGNTFEHYDEHAAGIRAWRERTSA